MKVLFLDFDGPLHPTDAVADLVYRGQDFGAVIRERNLFRWVKTLAGCLASQQDVSIVVHSSWRRFLGNEEIRQALGPLADQFAGVTSAELGRFEGIMEVVERLGLAEHEYLVLDDARDAFPAGFEQLVLVNPLRGVQEPAVRRRITGWASHVPQDAHAPFEHPVHTPAPVAALAPSVTSHVTNVAAHACVARKSPAEHVDHPGASSGPSHDERGCRSRELRPRCR